MDLATNAHQRPISCLLGHSGSSSGTILNPWTIVEAPVTTRGTGCTSTSLQCAQGADGKNSYRILPHKGPPIDKGCVTLQWQIWPVLSTQISQSKKICKYFLKSSKVFFTTKESGD